MKFAFDKFDKILYNIYIEIEKSINTLADW